MTPFQASRRRSCLGPRDATWRFIFSALTLVVLARVSVAEDVIGYDQVKDVFRKRCVTCHNPDELRGDLDLKDMSAIKAGSSSGDVVVAGDPAASLLYTTVAHLDDPVMPPNSPQISAREQDLIRRWIEGGLAERSGAAPSAAAEQLAMNGSELVQVAAQATVASSSTKDTNGWLPLRAVPRAVAITALDTHPTRDLAAVVAVDQAALFRPSTGELLGAASTPAGDVSAVRFSRDGALLLVASGTAGLASSVYAFDTESGKQVWTVGDETDSILTMDLSPDGKLLAMGGPAKTVRLYDVGSGKVVHSLKKHTDWILHLRFSPDGLLLASGDRFGGLLVWEPKRGGVFQVLKDHVGAVNTLAWDNDSETLLSGGEDGDIRTWNLHHGELTSRWPGEVGAILGLVRGSDFVAAAGRDGRVTLWKQPEELAAKFELSGQAEVLAHASSGELIVGDSVGQIAILKQDDLSAVGKVQLPLSSDAMEQLLVRLDKAEQGYVQNLASRTESSTAASMLSTALARDSNEPSTTSAVEQLAPMQGVGAIHDTSALHSWLEQELTTSRQESERVQDSLLASNELLAKMALSNAQLVETLRQLSQNQADLAQQVATQAQTLQRIQQRGMQLEQAIKLMSNGNGGVNLEQVLSVMSPAR